MARLIPVPRRFFFTPEERQWLAEHKTFRLGVGIGFPPFQWVERRDGKYEFKGMVSDYVNLLEEKLGVKMEVVFGITFDQALEYARLGKIDLLPCLAPTPERAEFLLFTNHYLSYPLTIITREDAPLISGVRDLKGKRVAAVKYLSIYSALTNDYPDLALEFVETHSLSENLEAVSLGRADACIINLAAASYFIQKKGLTNLSVAYTLDWDHLNLGMGVRRDWGILVTILEKTLASITQEEKDRISQRWIRVRYEPGVDIRSIWPWILGAGLGVGLIIAFFFVWNRSLQSEIKERKRMEKALLESEMRFDLALEAVNDGLWDWNLDTGDFYYSPRCFTMLGYEPDGMVATYDTLINLMHPEDLETFLTAVERHLRKGEPYEVEYRLRTKSGDWKWIMGRGELKELYGHRGKVRRMLGTHMDITERKKAELDQQIAADIVRSIPSGLLIYSYQAPDKLVLVNSNPAAEKFTGIEASRYRGRNFDETWPEAREQGITKAFVKVMETGWMHEIDSQYYKGRQVEGFYRIRAFAMPGSMLGVAFEDITEQHKVKKMLMESEELHRNLFEDSPTPLCIQDLSAAREKMEELDRTATPSLRAYLTDNPDQIGLLQGLVKITRVNQATMELFRAKVAPDILTGLDRLMPAGNDVYFTEQLLAFYEGKRIFEGRMDMVKLDGERFEIAVRKVVMTGHEHDLSQVLTAFFDMTEINRANREREQLEAQLRQSQKMEAVGTLASGVAHDFNNLLQVISGNVQLIQSSEGLDERLKKHSRGIEHAVGRAADLVQRLLTFSRKVEPELRAVDLMSELMQAVGLLERTIPKMININVRCNDDLKPISADSTQLNQVLMNLGANARDAMPDGGELTFYAENMILDEDFCRRHLGASPGEYVRLTVRDTGLGMEEETKKNVFTPFFTTKEIGKGTGLGLAMVYGIVKNHQGYIECESKQGEGATFLIYWPALEETAAQRQEITTMGEKARRGSESILLVDDERAVLEVTSEYLMEKGYAVSLASSGEEALNIFQQKKDELDLVILDLGMPGIGGFKALEILLEIKPTVKVVIASGYSLDGRIKEILKGSGLGFIHKPYRLGELNKKIREVVNSVTE